MQIRFIDYRKSKGERRRITLTFTELLYSISSRNSCSGNNEIVLGTSADCEFVIVYSGLRQGVKIEMFARFAVKRYVGDLSAQGFRRMVSYVAAIDQGTTSSRFIVFDTKGAIVAMHQLEFPQIYPRAGFVS